MEEKYKKLAEQGYEINFGAVLSDTWADIKKYLGSYIGFFIVSMILIVIGFIFLLIPVLGGGLMFALMAGYMTYSRAAEKGDSSFGNFFLGFKSLGQLCIYGLILALMLSPFYFILIYFAMPWEYYMEIMQHPEDAVSIMEEMQYQMEGKQLYMSTIQYGTQFLMLIVNSLMVFALPLIVDRKMKAWDAIVTSFHVAKSKFWVIFAILFVTSLITTAGIIFTCLLGMVVLVPFQYLVPFTLYKKVFDSIDSGSEVDTFGIKEQDVNTENDEVR